MAKCKAGLSGMELDRARHHLALARRPYSCRRPVAYIGKKGSAATLPLNSQIACTPRYKAVFMHSPVESARVRNGNSFRRTDPVQMYARNHLATLRKTVAERLYIHPRQGHGAKGHMGI